MTADWYFLKQGWFKRSKKVGPIDEHELLLRIDRGEIQPATLVQSHTKTRGRWIRMDTIREALKRYKKSHPSEER